MQGLLWQIYAVHATTSSVSSSDSFSLNTACAPVLLTGGVLPGGRLDGLVPPLAAVVCRDMRAPGAASATPPAGSPGVFDVLVVAHCRGSGAVLAWGIPTALPPGIMGLCSSTLLKGVVSGCSLYGLLFPWLQVCDPSRLRCCETFLGCYQGTAFLCAIGGW